MRLQSNKPYNKTAYPVHIFPIVAIIALLNIGTASYNKSANAAERMQMESMLRTSSFDELRSESTFLRDGTLDISRDETRSTSLMQETQDSDRSNTTISQDPQPIDPREPMDPMDPREPKSPREPRDPKEPRDPRTPMDPGMPGPGSGFTGTGDVQGLHEPYMTVTASNIDPNAPECATHDNTQYHSLWNEEEGCHYDHTHGVDPANTIFSDLEFAQGVSYPWETPNENLYKHKGYVNLYSAVDEGECLYTSTTSNTPNDVPLAENCVTHVLYQLHSLGTTAALRTRMHSYKYAARICNPDMTQCGIVTGGGHADYGTLHCPYKQAHCSLETDPINPNGGSLPDNVAMDQPPYRAIPDEFIKDYHLPKGIISQFWNNQQTKANYEFYPENPNQRIQTAWSFSDGWGWIDPANPLENHFQCVNGDCNFNHSIAHIYTFKVILKDPELVTNSNGNVINYSGYTDRNGALVSGCTQASTDCVPFEVSGVPAGAALMNRAVKQSNVTYGDPYDFDICFSDQGEVVSCLQGTTSGWIKPQQ